MVTLEAVHHVAIICSNYNKSKQFYVEKLGLKVISEHYRVERGSYKLDLAIDDRYVIELFSFPNPPTRVSRPEACGLRHLAFAVKDIEKAIGELQKHDIVTEPIRTDEYTGRRFTFFSDPDKMPIEIYEI